MKKINAKFITGMLAMALVFGMTGCPQGTNTVTKTVTVPGTSTPTQGSPVSTKAVPAGGPGVVTAFLKGELGNVDTLYISKPITLPDDSYILGNGKTIVVTDNPPPALSNMLTLPNAGALFNITTPTNTAVLTVNGTLTLANGSQVVLGSTSASTESGKLIIADGGKVVVASGAKVTTTTSSQIQLKTETSTLVFEDNDEAKLAIVGNIDVNTGENVVGVNTGTPKAIIVYPPSTTPDLTIGVGNVTINGSAANGTQLGGGGSFTGSTETVSSGSLNGVTLEAGETLVVSGDVTASETLNVPEGGTLEVTGSLTTSGALTVDGGGTLKVDGSLTTTGDMAVDNGASLTVAPGAEVTVDGGTLTADAEAAISIAKDATLTVANGGELDLSALEAGGSVTLEDSGTIEVASGGTLKLPAPAEDYAVEQIDYGTSSITINAGGKVYMVSTDDPPESGEDYYIGPAGSGAKYTWGEGTPSVELKAGGEMVLNGNLTSTDDNAINTKVTITENSTLTVADGLTMGEDAELVIEGAVKVAAGGTLDLAKYQPAPDAEDSASVTLNGTIEVASGGTVKALEPATGQIEWGTDGAVKLARGSSMYIRRRMLNGNTSIDVTVPYVGGTSVTGPGSVTISSCYTWDEALPKGDSYVLLEEGTLTVHANLTSHGYQLTTSKVNWITDNAFIEEGKLTVEENTVLLLANEATITVENGAELAVAGTLAIETTDSKLILNSGGKVSATADGTFGGWNAGNPSPNTVTGANNVKVRVSAVGTTTAKPAALTTAATNKHTLKTANDWSPAELSLTLGKFKIAKPENGNVITGVAVESLGTAGTLIAATSPATYITFAGTVSE
jgi:hypothetical protein